MKNRFKQWFSHNSKPSKKKSVELSFMVPIHPEKTFNTNDAGLMFAYDFFSKLFTMSFSDCNQFSVVFDIDDTILHVDKHVELCSPYILLLYKLFLHHGFRIQIVTARPYSIVNDMITKRQLADVGFVQYQQIYYLPSIWHHVGHYKATRRKQLMPILFSVGDQWTDIVNMYLSDALEQHSYWLRKPESGLEYALKLIPKRLR